MPTGIYERTEQHKLHLKQSQNKQTTKERRSKSMKSALSKPEIIEKYRQAAHQRSMDETTKQSFKQRMNKPESIEKRKIAIAQYMKTHKGPFKDTFPERQIHNVLLDIYGEKEIVSQFYVKGVGSVDKFIPKDNLIIEVDGDYWHNRPGKQEKDKIKTDKMKILGFKVLRFWEHDILENLQQCSNKIREVVA